MKILLTAGAVVLLGSSAFAFFLYQDNRSQQAHLENYENHVQQLLSQVEEISRQRLEHEKALNQLRSDLAQSNSQLISLSNQLKSARAQVNPDYVQKENEIRNRVAAEFAQQNDYQPRSHAALVRQLSEMDQTEFSTLISMQGQFGEFLNSLSVSDQRMEVIIGSLTNMVEQQNLTQQQLMEQQLQLRTDQVAEIRASGGGRQDVRQRLRNINFQNMQQEIAAIYSPEAQREALAFDLTDEEMGAFIQFQETNLNSLDAMGLGVTDSFGPMDLQGGQGTAAGVRVLQSTGQ